MKTEVYYISEGQFLAQLEPFKTNGLPTDSIIHKELTGCGATTLELEFERNSIIIEPNLPVIIGKCAKMNKGRRKYKIALGVHERITVDHITEYIANRKDYKKILTTPEGFVKVVEAIGPTVFKDYFLLFDECEKVIQDVSYRDRITDPLELFFLFEQKAFVSATPIIPSDPRFKEFSHVIIKPNYIFKHHLTVYSTNNIIFQLKKIFDSYNQFGETTNRKFFIFFKSTQRIRHIIEGLRIGDHAVFCSNKSVKDLKRDGILNAYDYINDKLTTYNFLTGRFFSAVDIDYKDYRCDPIIIMISDPLAIEHTVIDPVTEAIQIIGRFRAPEKVKGEPDIVVAKDIYHISNYNSKLTSFTKTEIEDILKDILRLHIGVTRFRNYSNTDYFNKFLNKILKVEEFSYFHRDSTPNYFMVDNFSNIERVKGCYQTSKGLILAYSNKDLFNVDASSGYRQFALTDAELREINSFTALPKVNQFVSQRLKEIMESNADGEYREFNLEMLRLSYPKQMAIIDKATLPIAAKLDYDIEQVLKQEKEAKAQNNLDLIRSFVQENFEINKGYTSEEVTELLENGIEDTGLVGHKANLKLLRKLAKLSNRENIRKDEWSNWLKGYRIIEFL